ncbi:hypothetical protein MRX96_054898 [Rhipicephalus microplus]
MPAIHNNKNAWSNGPPTSVSWSTDDPGQTTKTETTQPASNTKQGGQDQEPVNIPNSRRPFQLHFEIKDAAIGQISRQSDFTVVTESDSLDYDTGLRVFYQAIQDNDGI